MTNQKTGLPEVASNEVGAVPKRKINFWFTIISIIYLIDISDRNVISVVLPEIKKLYGLSDASVGLMGSILFLSLGLLVVPAGILVDRWSRKYMIAIMVTLWSGATWCTGLATSFMQMVISRLFVGVGESGYNPAGYALIGAWYPQRLRGRMVGIFNMAQPLGAALGMGIGGWVAYHYGWRSVFGLLAIPGFILAILILFAPDYKAKKLEAGEAHELRVKPMDALRFIFKNPTILIIYLAQLPIFFFIVSLTVWAPSWWMRTYNLNMFSAAKIVGVVTLVAGIGPFLGGWFSDWLTARSPRGRITATLVLLLLSALFYCLVFLGGMAKQPLIPIMAVATVAQLLFAGHYGSLIAAGLDLMPPHYRGTCQSFIPLFQTSTAFWSAAVCGLLSDRLGLSMALLIITLIGCLLGAALLLGAYRTYLTDYEKQKALGTFALEFE